MEDKNQEIKKQEQNDEELVARVQAGDMKAFNLLVMRYQGRVASILSRFVKADDVEEIAQESFMKAYKAINSFRSESAFYTWLYRIAVNTAKNHLTAQKKFTNDLPLDDDENFEFHHNLADIQTPDSFLEEECLKQVILKAFANLSEDLREAITLREIEGLSYEEISEKMGCPVGTVRSRIFRAREMIDNAIKAFNGD